MMIFKKHISAWALGLFFYPALMAQNNEPVQVINDFKAKRVDVIIGGKPFTSFLYPDTLEKPVLYPVRDAAGTIVTRGYPLNPVAGDPTDHPHHIGIWFNYENVNGLDFWNNSFAIAKEKKASYGWVKTIHVMAGSINNTANITYLAQWTNQQGDVLLTENTQMILSGTGRQRIIDRLTTLSADVDVTFKDAKDGLMGMRVAHALQMPSKQDQKFKDDKGNVTTVKAVTDSIANGNYVTSAGWQGDDAWSTRGTWCKLYGKMGADSVSIIMIDHPENPNYPTFWHARGYGLFAANPLGESIFTNGKSSKNLSLKKGDAVTFRYRIVIDNGSTTPGKEEIEKMAADFGKKK
jgi:hypothetical protein